MLTPLELDIMKVVWRHPPVTVREVHAAVQPSRHLAYTTVMTIMDRLYHKGFLTRKLKSRSHLYDPAVGYAEVRDAAVENLINSFFGRSRDELREFLDSHDGAARTLSDTPASSSLDETLL